jgi:hypothetical protein
MTASEFTLETMRDMTFDAIHFAKILNGEYNHFEYTIKCLATI